MVKLICHYCQATDLTLIIFAKRGTEVTCMLKTSNARGLARGLPEGGGYQVQSDLGLIMQYMVTKATRHQRNRNQE